jgi:hypothetical protein
MPHLMTCHPGKSDSEIFISNDKQHTIVGIHYEYTLSAEIIK